jgi:hypothetical protein
MRIENVFPPDKRRIVPVRLADVPVRRRRAAALRAAKHETDPFEVLEMRIIAEEPGDRIAWIAP